MNGASFVKPFYGNIATTTNIVADLQSQTRTQDVFANSILLMLVVTPHHLQNGEWSSHAATTELSPQQNVAATNQIHAFFVDCTYCHGSDLQHDQTLSLFAACL